VVITVTGANAAGPVAATDNNDGTYTASYTPTVAGTDQVGVTLDGSPVSGSPFSSTVAAGAVDPASSSAVVPDGVAGNPTTITVVARDQFGNQVATGGASVSVDITGANPGSASVTDNGDGTYTATYTPAVSGTDTVSIQINSTPVQGSPFTSIIS
jgi:hypothetical protein